MKTTLTLTALAAAAAAQDSYYNITSKPFQLVLTSADGSIDDTVSACHTGAGLESLCLSNSNSTSKPDPTYYDTFNFNTSIYYQPPSNDPDLGVPGILTWFLPTANAGSVPSSVYFSYDPATDSTVPIIRPGSTEAQTLAFNSQDELIVQSYVDWAANPPTGTQTTGLKRWYACRTYFSGYQYDNLVWGLGNHKPENPTCVAVNVKRVFV
ncbi:hypothetical protein FB567DRAFT_248968 [Paraphoma chrysanthemicola]|uniref:DUF7907 domain-containing protein n=1 Tax=Paraphoma chrysanthemicola TaxID=798071 RepID=A0A8K0QSW5_9PLEO|nr:hypothetical protein FB567DRAFT_248968 [Paraphoma chrysanthemicola]